MTSLKNAIKKLIQKTFLYKIYLNLQNIYLKKIFRFLKRKRKEWTIKYYGRRFGIEIFIETGTYLGDMVEATKASFKKIISIELDPALYEKAKRRFSNYNHITIIHGDSAKVLPGILTNINHNCLFWLDAHDHSKAINAFLKTPIKQELFHIFSHSLAKNLEHVILIDDARLFIGKNSPTLKELKSFVLKNRPNWIFEVKNDIIRIYKK